LVGCSRLRSNGPSGAACWVGLFELRAWSIVQTNVSRGSAQGAYGLRRLRCVPSARASGDHRRRRKQRSTGSGSLGLFIDGGGGIRRAHLAKTHRAHCATPAGSASARVSSSPFSLHLLCRGGRLRPRSTWLEGDVVADIAPRSLGQADTNHHTNAATRSSN